jgi:hypothetical protein
VVELLERETRERERERLEVEDKDAQRSDQRRGTKKKWF